MSVASFLDRKERISDVLMNFHFHVFDVSATLPVALSLVYGFQHCTAPELTANTREIKEGTFEYPHHVLESAAASEINFTRGAKFFDSDFYDWITGYIRGEQNQRRNLLIVQYSQINSNAAVNARGPNLVTQGISLQPLYDLVSRIPARAWLLYQCVPTQYKSSSDFDAQSHEISLQTLTIKMRHFEEFNSGI
jgi:phage tail-like protein